MNADGSPNIDIGITGSAKIPFLTALGVIFIALGIVGMTGGAFLTYYGVRPVRDRRPESTTPAASAPDPIVTG